MKFISFLLLFPVIFCSCRQKTKPVTYTLKKIDSAWIDSVIKSSDSSYTKPYKRTDFVTAAYYINTSKNSICQVMKDSAGMIRQVILSKNNVRTFFAQYYQNGQIMAELPLDSSGQYHGLAAYYYIDGRKQSKGNYVHGMRTGKWTNYNNDGKIISIDEYNADGNLMRSVKQ